jgi:PST family polysaccharide transporter
VHSDDVLRAAAEPFTPPFLSIDQSGHSLVRNASALFLGQSIGLIAPLVTIPYLARVLGPAAWGPVIAAQALGNWLILIFEFGFDLSGTRAVARARVEPHTLPAVVHGVQSAKTLLVLGTLPLLAIVLFAIPALRAHPALIGWAVIFAAFRGLNPLWFFQGIERVQGPVLVDTAARSAAAFGVFVFVRSPLDGWRVLALQAVFAGIALVGLTLWLARHVPLRRPRAAAAIRTLREGSSIFACRAWTGLYIQGNALILAAIASPATVAFFGGAERIVRAAINMLQPLTQAFLPRLSYLQETDRPAAQRMIRGALAGVGLLGVVMGLVAYIAAPLLVQLLLGPQYAAAVPVLQLLGALPMLVAINTVLGLYWALPLGYERYFLVSIIAAGVTNVAAALVLVPRLGAAGMALSAIGAEIVVLLVLGARYLREGA